MFVIDTNKEVDRHRRGAQAATFRSSPWSTPTAIRMGSAIPIPGNDDAGRAITLYCDLIARAALDGIERAQGSAGVDLGAAEEPLGEPALDEGEEAGRAAPSRPRPTRERKPARRDGRGGPTADGNGKRPDRRRGAAARGQGRAPQGRSLETSRRPRRVAEAKRLRSDRGMA